MNKQDKTPELTQQQKKVIDKAVKKTVKKYHKTLRLLAAT